MAHTEDNLLYPHLARLEVKGLDFSEHDKKVIEAYKEDLLKRKDVNVDEVEADSAKKLLKKIAEVLMTEGVSISMHIDELEDFDNNGVPKVYSREAVLEYIDFTRHDERVIERYLAEHNVDDNEECCEKLPDAMKKMYDGLDQSLNALSERMKILSKKVAQPYEVDKCVRHEAVCTLLNDIYQQKNAAYGDSFGNTYRELGIISAVTRISDKYNRLKTLARNTEIPQGDEAIADTLLDMANYCIMTYMEMESECCGRNCKNDL